MKKKRIIAEIVCINGIPIEYGNIMRLLHFIEIYLCKTYRKYFYTIYYDAKEIDSGKVKFGFKTEGMTVDVSISENTSDKVEVVYAVASSLKLSDNSGKRDHYQCTYLFDTVSDAEKYVSSKYEETSTYLKNDPLVEGEILKLNEARTDCDTIVYSIVAHRKNEGSLSHSWYIYQSQRKISES